MNSLAVRLLLGAGIVLTVFVIGTALATHQAVQKRALEVQFDKLQGLIYGLLGASDSGSNGTLLVNEFELPDGQLKQPGADLVAQIDTSGGRTIWRSASLYFDLPEQVAPAVGDWRFSRVSAAGGRELFVMQFTVEWFGDQQSGDTYTFTVAQNTAPFDRQIEKFEARLWLVLLIAAALLLIVLLAVLHWSLKPLKRVADAVKQVEEGQIKQLPTRVPRELEGLTRGLNSLLQNEYQRQSRYKNALDDLAHSLKTPLSVIRNIAGNPPQTESDSLEVCAQVDRMDEIVARQLHTTAIDNRSPLARRFNLHTLIERIRRSLLKVHPEKDFTVSIAVDKALSVRLNEGDTMEILGNLMENASKYCTATVKVSGTVADDRLLLAVEDDGPGFPEEVSELLQRGSRRDTHYPGQGLGLSIVEGLVTAMGGELKISNGSLGGGLVTLSLPIA